MQPWRSRATSQSAGEIPLRTAAEELLAGPQGQIEVARHPDCKTVVTGIVGCAGLIPTIEAIKAKKDIALANKAPNAFKT